MLIDLFLIAFLSACFGTVWANELCSVTGLLWFIPKYYPYEEKFLGKLLRCGVCLSGWSCLITCLIFGYWLLAIPFMFVAMATAKFISK
jgi:hypothetical protein